MIVPKNITPETLNMMEEVLNMVQNSLILKAIGNNPLTAEEIKQTIDDVRFQVQGEVMHDFIHNFRYNAK